VVADRLERVLDKVAAPPTASSASTELFARLDALLSSSYAFLFMKGTPQEPKCKFSRRILELLAGAGVTDFGSFNVLSDESVRQGLKEYSNWPTFPQLFAGGKLVGGVDIAEELAKDGQLASVLAPAPPQPAALAAAAAARPKASSLEDRLRALVNRAPVVIFIKGTPAQPVCGFSAKLVQVLADHGVQYDSFNILEDEEVRQGLKKFSDWPTYPQVYAKGKLVGGLDIVKELADEGALVDALAG